MNEPSGIVATGNTHSLVLAPDGSVFMFGEQNGTPQIIPHLPPIASVSAGNRFSLFVDCDGSVWGLGNSTYGELECIGNFHTPTKFVFNGENVKIKMAAASHNFYSLFLDEDGVAWGCGYNAYGQLGLSHLENSQILTSIPNLPKITSISAGYYHSLFLDESGDVWACGYNAYGQLGRRTEEEKVPDLTKIEFPVKMQAVSAGNFHSIFLDVNGKVWGSGHNSYGSLPLSHLNTVFVPEMWEPDTRIQFIVAGVHKTLLIDEEGGLWYTSQELIGNNGRKREHAGKLPEIAIAISAACESHCLVIDADGQVWVWGTNEGGRLGLGSSEKMFQNVPVKNTFLPCVLRRQRTKSARNV